MHYIGMLAFRLPVPVELRLAPGPVVSVNRYRLFDSGLVCR